MHTEPKGFTVIELLIAITISVFLLGIVLAIYVLTIRSLGASQTRGELSQNSRTVIERITRDIRQTRDIVTILPETTDEEGNPPPSEIILQDGHEVDFYQYIRYYLTGTNLKRSVLQYSFSEDPSVLVPYDAEDDFGNPPDETIVQDTVVGMSVSDIDFYGLNMIFIDLILQKNNITHQTGTHIYGRNL